MSRIDKQMLQIHQTSTQECSDQGRQISDIETLKLIARAEKINTSSSCFSGHTHKGNKSLKRLMKEYPTDFSPQSRGLILKYINTGRIPTVITPNSPPKPNEGLSDSSSSSHSGIGRNIPGTNLLPSGDLQNSGIVITRPDGPTPGNDPVLGNAISSSGINEPIYVYGPGSGAAISSPGTPVPGNRPDSGVTISVPGAPVPGNAPGSGVVISRPGNGPVNEPSIPIPGNRPDSGGIITGPGSPTPSNGTGTVGPYGKIILDFQTQKKTWGCHWFPLQETKRGGDPTNNLYAEGGPLAKLDMVTGGQAREYEFGHNRKAVDSGPDYSWWGHCDKAAEVACVLQAPKNKVVMQGRNGEPVTFSLTDIQGLLVKVSGSLVNKVDFRGERFDDASHDDINDPAPDFFMGVLREWEKDGIPFVIDLDRGRQVWNFPYDQVRISESDVPPAGGPALPSDGSVKYYHIEMSGTGFERKRRTYKCYVQSDSSGNVQKSGWIGDNPDFMWRPHPIGDLMDKSIWKYRGHPSNPEVDPQVVYDIYIKSLG